MGCLFILLIVSFAQEKLFHLIWSHLFIFAFVACAFSLIDKKSLSNHAFVSSKKLKVEELNVQHKQLEKEKQSKPEDSTKKESACNGIKSGKRTFLQEVAPLHF